MLLAAGAGTRFGGGKLLQPLPDGTALGLRALRNLKTALMHTVAVVRAEDQAMYELLAAEASMVVRSARAHLGMGHSLADAIAVTDPSLGWVIALGDMPAIQPSTFTAVAQALAAQQKIILPCYRGERGHPVAIPARFRAVLLRLTGDAGARDLIRQHPTEVYRLELEDPGILRDIDTLQDLAAYNDSSGPPA